MNKTGTYNQRIKASTFFTILLATGFALSILYHDYNLNKKNFVEEGNPESIEDSIAKRIDPEFTIEAPNIIQTDPTTEEPFLNTDPIEKHEVLVNGWIPSWGFAHGLNTLSREGENFYSVSPVWYSVNSNGTLVDRRNKNWSDVMKYQDNVRIIPSIGVFDAEVMHSILGTPAHFNTHVNDIVNEVVSLGFDGIDIDYEVIFLKDKENYLRFLKVLGEELRSEGKILSVTILTQWGDGIAYSSFPETRQVQQIDRIAQYADEIRVMTYDFTPSSSRKPGPVAPINWINAVVEYTISKAPAEKVWLGVHLYGYEWDSNGRTRAITYSALPKLEAIADFQFAHNRTYEEGIATYTCKETLTCTTYFQTPEGINARIQVAEKHKLAGIAFWRIGDEGTIFETVW